MSELAAESAQRRSSARRASALLDQEQMDRVEAVKVEEATADMERKSNQRRASAMLDLEQASRIQMVKTEAEMDKSERVHNQRRASKALDAEQTRRVNEAMKEDTDAKAERVDAQADAAAALDAEQARRIEELKVEEEKVEEERKVNQTVATKMMDAEKQERESEKGPVHRKSLVAEAGVLEELTDEVDEADHITDGDVEASKGQGVDAGERAVISEKASANVDYIMAADNDDESLRKYKEQLMGSAANGDRGDTSDPRKVIVTEFRVVFEDAKTEDIVFNLDTEEGVAAMTKTGISMKEGSNYKFKLGFRVNHEILTGLKFTNKVMKGVFWNTDDLVIGSFAPQTKAYEFEFPRYEYNTAPSGMMFRGTYKSKNTFGDSDGNNHLEFEYKVNITK